MKRASLIRTNFLQATLERAFLREANLEGATLNRANLSRANLSRANFERAFLREANLEGTDLRSAIFLGTDLYETNLHESILEATVFASVNLDAVKGLKTLKHRGPSAISVDTIYHSHANIPEDFLRSAGVPEVFIEYMHSLMVKPIDYYSVFISYSHADASFARRLHDALQGRGIRCWLDEHQMLPGHAIYDEIDRGIRLWDKILLCASQDSLKSWWVDNEIDKAFTKEQQLMQDRGTKIRALIPLNLDGALWQWQDGKADQVRSRLAADFTGWEHDNAKFERAFEKLVRALRTDEGREVPPPSRL